MPKLARMPFAASVSRICEAYPASAPASKLKATIFPLASPLRMTSAGLPSGGSVTGCAGGVGGTGTGVNGEDVGVTVVVGHGGVGFAVIVTDGDGEPEGPAESDAPLRAPQPKEAKTRMTPRASQ